MVIVTVNYRLNVFGFLGSADLQKRTSDGSTGNAGIQVRCLHQRFVFKVIYMMACNCVMVEYALMFCLKCVEVMRWLAVELQNEWRLQQWRWFQIYSRVM